MLNNSDMMKLDAISDDEGSSSTSTSPSYSSSSSISESDWKPEPVGQQAILDWAKDEMGVEATPRAILQHLLPNVKFEDSATESELWRVIWQVINERPKRVKLAAINTLEDTIALIKNSKNIVVLTGAGISVSCGIPDFRSQDGVYARLSKRFPDLADPQSVFDIKFFIVNPYPFFEFAKEIYPGLFRPSLCHRFIKALEIEGKLLRNYTQNIDTLEQAAGISKVVYCHGSFATASCVKCRYKVNCEGIRADIFNQRVPRCPKCSPRKGSIMKPDIVFFGENLPPEFYRSLQEDEDVVDLLIIMGSSMKVRPVAYIPDTIPAHVPQIFINREPLSHMNFDVELYGNCDEVINEICTRLGGSFAQLCSKQKKLTECQEVHIDFGSGNMEESTVPKRRKVALDPLPNRDFCVQEDCDVCSVNAEGSACVGETSSSFQGDDVLSVADNDADTKDIPLSSTADAHGHSDSESSANTKHDNFRKNGTSRWMPLKSIAAVLPENSFLHMPPNKYVFPGAEIYCTGNEQEESESP